MHIGLGLACSVPVLTPAQTYLYARGAGFPPAEAVQMTAIAMRESGLCPTAYYAGKPAGAESSYGLTQINVKGNPNLLATMGITADQLYDPATNMAAAALLWGGNDANLNAAWSINAGGYYTQQYQIDLPIAQAAAQSAAPSDFDSSGSPTDGSGSGVVVSSSTADPGNWLSSVESDVTSGTVSLAGFDVPILYLVLGGLAVTVLLFAVM